jgi:hypothetical protein
VSGSHTDEREIRVIAIISTYNEADVIGQVIRHLVEDGVDVYVIDNHSTDDTVAEAQKWVGRGVLDVELFPSTGADGLFRWQEILDRKLSIAGEIRPDWVIHHDADEIRYGPWASVPLREAVALVDRHGFNAIDFRLLNFPPVDDGFTPDADPAQYFTLYEEAPERDRIQIKCWKWRSDVRFLDGGHDVQLPGKKVFPIRFILCHYPVRGQTQGLRKVFEERKGRFVEAERAIGWHIQYDEIESTTHRFLRDPASLQRFDLDSLRVGVQLEHATPHPDVVHAPLVPEEPYEGVLDVAGPDEISGWAWCPVRADDPVEVDLWASDRLLATVRADIFRPDLRQSGKGSGKHAFSFRTSDLHRDGRRYWIWANIAGTALALENSPSVFERRANA